MTKLTFRAVVLIPAIAGLLSVLFLFRGHPEWPTPALQYLTWYQATPLTTVEHWAMLSSELGLVGLVAASVGVLFFWSAARYAYLASLLLAIAADFTTVPILVGMPEILLDNLIQVFAGASLGLMFTQPCATWFVRARKA